MTDQTLKLTLKILVAVCLFLLLTIGSFACASTSGLRQEDSIRKMNPMRRAVNFYIYLENKEYERIWEMASKSIRSSISKEDYTQELELLLQNLTPKAKKIKIVVSDEDYAVIEAFVTANSRDRYFSYFCERMIWIWEDNDWFFTSDTLKCDSLPDEERIRQLLNR